MAISIKNHEDRITALENKGYTFKTLYDKNVHVNANQTIQLSSSIQDYDVIIVEGRHDDDTNYDQLWVVDPYINKEYIHAYYDQNDADMSSLQFKFASKTSLYITVSVRYCIVRIIGLKLYYNFSYNITREFYVVKFNKLRHYLCSHLRNYASNKGGVIQNGY